VKKAALWFASAACASLLTACSLTRVAYNYADSIVPYMASNYLDLDAEQSERLRPLIVRFHEWHRTNELPVYAALLRSASERAAKGLTADDVAWAMDSLRSRYRRLAAKAAEDAAPVLATLEPAQLAVLEHKFAESNEKYAKEYLSTDDAKRKRVQAKRMLDRFRDIAGSLTHEQEARIERFALDHERHVELRFEDRQHWQRDLVAVLREHRDPKDLGPRLAHLFYNPELRRSEEFSREDKRWNEDFGQLIADLDRTLSDRQRAHVVKRLSGYAEDFSTLAGKKGQAT
jgi:hypothetical protein